jgi:hypothetical protein
VGKVFYAIFLFSVLGLIGSFIVTVVTDPGDVPDEHLEKRDPSKFRRIEVHRGAEGAVYLFAMITLASGPLALLVWVVRLLRD